jgi:death-on-curing protein
MSPQAKTPSEIIDASEVAAIHEAITTWFLGSEDPISPAGIKSKALLESAVARPFQTVGGKDAFLSEFDKASALFHALINNHPFHNGNKRAALVASQVLLHRLGYWLEDCTDEELYEFTTKVAAHEICDNRADEIPLISSWFEAHCRRVIQGERPLKYTELKQILQRLGYEIDPPDGQFLYIKKDNEIVLRIIKQGIHGLRPYHTDYVAGMRKKLGLTVMNGFDSDRFYGRKGLTDDVTSEVIELRSEALKKLAKT